jgi:hypothetical protein
MKMSTKFATLAIGAASLIAILISPASAQTVGGTNCLHYKDQAKGSNQNQCVTRLEGEKLDKESEIQRNGPRVTSFLKANPAQKVTDVPANDGSYGQITVYDGVDGRGRSYRILTSSKGFAASGSASFLNTRPGGGGSGGKRSTN